MLRRVLGAAALIATTAVAQTPAVVAPAPVPVAVAAATPVPEKIICKSTVETGSLVKKNKVCLTKKQWVHVNNESESAARRIVDENGRNGACTTNC